MIRQIIIPQQNQHIIQFPDEMLGKQVEVVAFAIEDAEPRSDDSVFTSPEQLSEMLKGASFNANGWKFNRDEVNDYD